MGSLSLFWSTSRRGCRAGQPVSERRSRPPRRPRWARTLLTHRTFPQVDMPLLVHGEVTDPAIDFFDREAVFMERILTPLLDALPGLRVVMEHITTKQAAAFVAAAPKNVAASITPQHILWNRNSLFVGGLRPHAFCLPILKREVHREAVADAAMSDSGKFFLGTDRYARMERQTVFVCFQFNSPCHPSQCAAPTGCQGVGVWLRGYFQCASRAAAVRPRV